MCCTSSGSDGPPDTLIVARSICDRSGCASYPLLRWERPTRGLQRSLVPFFARSVGLAPVAPPRGLVIAPSTACTPSMPFTSSYSFNPDPKPINTPARTQLLKYLCAALPPHPIGARSRPSTGNLRGRRRCICTMPIERGRPPAGSTMKFRQNGSSRCHSPSLISNR